MQRVPRNLIWATSTNFGVGEGFSEEVTSESSRRRKSLSGGQPGKRVFHARREAFVEAQGNRAWNMLRVVSEKLGLVQVC